jgi:hypothetical protein
VLLVLLSALLNLRAAAGAADGAGAAGQLLYTDRQVSLLQEGKDTVGLLCDLTAHLQGNASTTHMYTP